MFIFHEGLPRSGKSYEAMVKRIIPALQKGRKVFARLNGMDYEKIAEVAEMPLERVRELLHEIPKDKVKEWFKVVENDSLVILDELQNFWPDSGRRLPLDQIEAISEHGHRGLDIVGMGQLLKGKGGCDANWVNRCDQKIVFEKQNARGADDKYRWTAYKGKLVDGKIQFLKVNTGVVSYDKKYFGTYATRVDGSDNAETYQDARTNVWNNPVLRKFAPAMLICAGVAVWYLWHAFKGGGLEKSLGGHKVEKSVTVTSTPPAVTSASAVQVGAAQAQPAAAKSAPVSESQKQDAMSDDYVATISQKWRPRLSGLVWGAKGARLVVEWYDESFRLKERFSAAQLEEFGWGVARSAYGEHIILSKGGVHIAVTSWPMESFGKVSEADSRAIASQSSGGAPGFGPSDWRRDEGVSGGGGSVVSRDSGSDWPGYGADGLVKHAKPVRSILTSG
ncbi:zonular occludens toxin domain-containing protein [Ralstonia thomasii]